MKGPVVLLGPPGAGKSTAGKQAAARLGMRFVDLDNVTDADRVFRDEGEPAFRVREYLALEAALDGSDVLVSAGAGVVDTRPGRDLLERRALCVVLDVDADTALARLGSSPRPWLPDVTERRATYLAREQGRRAHREHLARAPFVDGNAALADVTAALALTIDGLHPVFPVELAPDVDLVRGLHAEPLSLAELLPEGAVVLVEDAVAELHPRAFAGLTIDIRAGGEGHKDLAHVERIANALFSAHITRDSLVVAVGGGAFLDTAGLAASLALRGVRWWAVPTTLLAQADAGVGGKTAVNAHDQKNMLGAFHPPERTLVDTRFLATLDAARLRDGAAEMLKHEFLAGTHFDVDTHPGDAGGLAAAVARSLALKLSVVRRDPKERGLRAVLNLGHTVAHALEASAAVTHGEAVRHGLRAMLKLSVEHAGLDPAVAASLDARIGPLRALDVDARRFRAALSSDKKAGRFVLLRAPGLPVVHEVDPLSVIPEAL